MIKEEPAMVKEIVMDVVALASALGFNLADENAAAIGSVLFVVVSVALQFKGVRAKVCPLVKSQSGGQVK